MAIIRGTTPTLTFHVKDETLNLNEIVEAWVTFKTKAGVKPKEITFGIEDLTIDAEEHTITLNLSQENTLDFSDTNMVVQMRVKFENNMAYASSIMDVDVGHILKEGVI